MSLGEKIRMRYTAFQSSGFNNFKLCRSSVNRSVKRDQAAISLSAFFTLTPLT